MQWDELRRQARKLESDLDLKLTSFGKLGLLSGTLIHVNAHQSDQCSSPDFSSLCDNIEVLLERLTQVNDNMTDVTSNYEHITASQQHTAKRHREILFDYIQDFKRIQTSYTNARNREELLTSASPYLQKPANISDKPSEATHLLLEEQQSLLNTDQMLSDRIAAASAIRSALRSHHRVLKSATGSLLNLRARFPIVNKVMNNISWRKRRDSIIVGALIGFCVLFLLIYLFH